MKLWVDTETYSETPINHGTYAYIRAAGVMVITFAVDDGPTQVIDRSDGDPVGDFTYAAFEADEVWAHNAMFDRNVIDKAFPGLLPLHKWRCNMVQAMAHGLPGGLDKLCDILKIPTDQAKHKRGKELIKLFCVPRQFCHSLVKTDYPTPKAFREAVAAAREAWTGRATRLTHPREWQEFLDYAEADIDAMRAVNKKLPTWNYKGQELALWHLDQQINDRGFAVDLDLANAAIAAVEKEKLVLADTTYGVTGGELASTTQRDRLLEYILAEHGILLPDMTADTVERRIEDPDLPRGLRDLLAVRLQATTTSVSKYKRLVNATTDGRMRGALQFDGAARTGRWAGRNFQPQNLPRPTWNPDESDIDAIKAGCADRAYANVMEACSNVIRGCIVAPPGKKLVVADLANIEGRAAAWLAGEEWKLDAFRAFDAGTGPDLYKVSYASSFGVDPKDVTKEQRQIGKVQELMLGYEGGVGAYATGAVTYGIDLEAMAEKAWYSLPEEALDAAREMLAWFRSKGKKDPPAAFGMTEKTWLVCEAFVLGWRSAHPAIKSTWKSLKEVAIAATLCPGETMTTGKFKIRRDGAWLRIGLPSGRALCYPHPEVDKDGLTYMGMNQYTRKWTRLRTYGGKIFENACQALAAHQLKDAMPGIEDAGFQIVLTVHDEVLTEAEPSTFNVDILSRLLARNHDWNPDMPLAAAGFEAQRYRKE